MPINIAIDGPSAAGKSTIAKRLAKELNYIHLDTGAMYRATAFASKYYHVDIENHDALVNLLKQIDLSFLSDGSICLDKKNISNDIRSNEISMLTSLISQKKIVREMLVEMQQTLAKQKGYILDGRDIGTVVLPDAEVKIYMIATVEDRAQRRVLEYQEKGIKEDYDVIFKDIEQRDYQDIHREFSPLKKAVDAIEIDTSSLSIEEVVSKILSIIDDNIKKEGL